MPQVAARLTAAPTARRDLPWWGWLAAGLAAYALAVLTLRITASGAVIAPWWPAAGLTTILLLMAPKRQLWAPIVLTLIVTLAANLTIGRPPLLAALYCIANTVEMVVLAGILGLHRRPFTLDTMRAAVRFIMATLVAAIVLGSLVGSAAWMLTGVSFLTTSSTAAASHIAAVLLIGPFGALPPAAAARSRVPLWEALLQAALLAAAVAAAFRPGADLPLSFVVFSFLGWGLLRQRVVIAYAQTLVTAIAVLLLTRFDPTSFGSQALPKPDVVLTTVVFLCTLGIFTVLMVTARYEIERAHAISLRTTQDLLDTERERTEVLRLKLELERQREDFVATTSHELRTPITSIAGYTELLSESPHLDPRERDWVDVIDRNTARLTELVEDLLALGRASSPVPSRAVQPVPARELVDDTIATHRPSADAKAITVTASVDDTVLHGSPSDIRRALTNLVTNAIKFTPASGVIEISVVRRDDTATVTVTDTGPGMSADTFAHAFERFYRGADAEQLSTPGTGLGLSIVRELIERNGGRVWLEHPDGGGLRAGFALPATAGTAS
ncbi:sensor histidine kinase [Microbacterium telephonicum]|uniref:histidine kinase n=1 Tax=Microbacterium telephonicum TaxID=1714841 RepID=A0A498BWF7_9MICO|nr:HAMP domain-containing sensor histidine kinase [Microbacterium telephonicum]RLK47994.1 signal transduction histidine kinase [Microbacterium telephonicum]